MPQARTGAADQDKRFGRVYDPRVVRRLWPFLAPYKTRLALAVVCMLGGAGCALAAPYIIKLALDGAIAARHTAALAWLVALYAGNAVLSWSLRYGETVIVAATAQQVLFDLRRALFTHLIRLDLAYHDRHAVGRSMSRVQNDVGVLQDLFASGALSIIGDLVMLGGIVAILLSMHVTLTLITCAAVPPVILLTVYWRTHSRRAFQRVREALARVNGRLQENIAGVRVIQSLVSEKANLRRFRVENRAHLEANLYAARLTALLLPSIEVVSIGAIVLVLLFGGPMVLAGSLSAGSLVAFVLYMMRLFEPIRDISFRWNYLQMAMASGERIFEVLDAPIRIREAAHPVVLHELRGEVEFREVGFHYRSGTPVLRQVSLKVDAAQHVALVGPTGAGKTTLVNLIARFYDVTEGRLLIDGIDVRMLPLADLRGRIGLVLQEPFLFSGTIRENMRYGNPDADEDAIIAAARRLGVHQHIMRLPNAYDTDVSERGGLLSYGQRQLISFVRALLIDPRILILDEATASIDAETEQILQAGLERLIEGRTAFIIAHRLSTVRHADRIVVLDQGCVVEDGSHEALLTSGGLYARLHMMTYAGIATDT